LFARRGRIGLLCAALTASAPGSVVAPATAWAQDADAAYRQHMQNGVKLYQERNWAGAEAEFQAAYDAKRKAAPLMNIALCQKAQFRYPRAVATLKRALADHADTLDAADAKAAREAIADLESLLAYVDVVVTPANATVRVDGEELTADAARKPVPLGPGPHRFSASAPGYTSAEQSITVSSGDKDRKVELRLVASQGYLTVTTRSPKHAIDVDQKYVGTGRWSGLLEPGTHSVFIYLPGSAEGGVAGSVVISAGKLHELDERDPVFTPFAAGQAGADLGGPAQRKPDPIPDYRGLYAAGQVAGFSFVGPLAGDAGISLGGRLGLRMSTPFAIEGMLQLDQAGAIGPTNTVVGEDGVAQEGGDADFRAIRLGGNAKLMTRGRVARFVGAIGGGVSFDSLDFTPCPPSFSDLECYDEDTSGVNAFVNTEGGVEIDIRGFFFGAVLQQMLCTVSSLDAPNTGNFAGFVGLGLRVGYGTW
jgi:hypothetical protein